MIGSYIGRKSMKSEWEKKGREAFCGDTSDDADDIGKKSGGRDFWICI